MSLWPAIAKLFAMMCVVWLVTPIFVVVWCGRQCSNKGERMKRLVMAILVAAMVAAAAHNVEAIFIPCGMMWPGWC